MKILYITQAMVDYLSDSIYHGLVSLGEDVVDYNALWYLYRDDLQPALRVGLYGSGFGLSGTLPGTAGNIDRSDIRAKLQHHYYDLVIYGSVWRCMDLWQLVRTTYRAEQIILLDGEDYTYTAQLTGYPYFKRELIQPMAGIRPIGFSLPREKFRARTRNKRQVLATNIPGDQSTYKFSTEADYYDDYGQSYYGYTTKKAGWDSLRHYEILAAGCLPLFPDLDACPSTVLTHYPKPIVQASNRLLHRALGVSDIANLGSRDPADLDIPEYWDLLYAATDYAAQYLTTVRMARYLLDETVIRHILTSY